MHRVAALRLPVGQRWPRQCSDALCEALAQSGYEKLIDWRGVTVFVQHDAADLAPLILPHNCGLVLGPLFRRDAEEQERVREIPPDLAVDWLKSSGQALTDAYWGGYLAFLADRERDRLIVVRDPTGARPCFTFERGGVRVFTSHPSDLLLSVDVDQVRLAGFLCHPRLSLGRTGVEEVEELASGEIWRIGRTEDLRVQAWTPLGRVRPRPAEVIASEVKASVELAAAAMTSGHDKVLHRLSGGLDSSIVLAGLAQARRARPFELLCVNEFSPDVPEGDERILARLTAERFNVNLVEMAFTPRPFAEARRSNAWSPNPGFTLLNTGALSFMEAMSAHRGALLTSGQGGDHVFQRNRTLHLASDAARRGQLTFDLAMSLARMSGVSLWKLLGHAASHASATFGRLRQDDYAAPSAIATRDIADQAIHEHFEHAWLEGWRRAPPGEVLRALHVLEATHYHGLSVLHESFTPAPILVSQPVIEACLSAPTYVMAPGVERGLIRQAYADDLPAEVLGRTTKGETTRFFVAQLEAQWPALRELLLGGLLVQQEAVQPARLETMLAANRVPDLNASADLMTCVAAELWLRALPL
jgi:asparagine synthase (glutamine-hydrolysing)